MKKNGREVEEIHGRDGKKEKYEVRRDGGRRKRNEKRKQWRKVVYLPPEVALLIFMSIPWVPVDMV